MCTGMHMALDMRAMGTHFVRTKHVQLQRMFVWMDHPSFIDFTLRNLMTSVPERPFQREPNFVGS